MRTTLAILTVLAACGPVPSESHDAGPRMSSRQFSRLSEALGRRTERVVAASGEARLGDDDAMHRWARLDPEAPARGRGGYVIEDGSKVWLVTYETTGRTEAWTGTRASHAIEHTQFHHHGSETVVFALRDGQPVVLAYELIDDGDEDGAIRLRFAIDGVCVTRCPALRGFETQDARFEVVGPADDLASLAR
jgi:hypothetical protein